MRHEHEIVAPKTSEATATRSRPAKAGDPKLDSVNAWDCFTGPATFIPDDRYPPALMPGLVALHGFAVATEFNRKLLRGLTGLPPKSGSN